MNKIILDLCEIGEAEVCPEDKIQKVERELNEEEIEWYNANGWQYYTPDLLLPVLGPTIYTSFTDPVVEIFGRRWKIQFLFDYNYEPYEAKGKKVVFSETTEPLTVSDKYKNNRHSHDMQIFGQPVWVQHEYYPAYKGEPCYHLATLETGWGDCGNNNILIACENNEPVKAFFEASCC